MHQLQSVVSQKKMYYCVRVHAVQQRAKGDCRVLQDKMKNQKATILARIRRLHHCLKWVSVRLSTCDSLVVDHVISCW